MEQDDWHHPKESGSPERPEPQTNGLDSALMRGLPDTPLPTNHAL
jgi:hypothetical protein